MWWSLQLVQALPGAVLDVLGMADVLLLIELEYPGQWARLLSGRPCCLLANKLLFVLPGDNTTDSVVVSAVNKWTGALRADML